LGWESGGENLEGFEKDRLMARIVDSLWWMVDSKENSEW